MDEQSSNQGSDMADGHSPDMTVTKGPLGIEDIGSIERASLASSLNMISQRLSALEVRLERKPADSKATSPTWVELSKILFGGWPAFGLVFMLLFYTPIRDAINAIPEKVKSADEIGVLGVSLKNTIRVEAEKIGSLQLSETLPTLTPAAVEFMLRASREYNSLVSYNHENGLLKAIWLPNEQALKLLEELEAKKLAVVQLTLNADGEKVADLRKAIADFRKRHPAREESFGGPNQIHLELETPAKTEIPHFAWRLTDLGKNAVNVILKAVSSQLTPTPKKLASANK